MYSPLFRLSRRIFAVCSPVPRDSDYKETLALAIWPEASDADYTGGPQGGTGVPEVGILIVDNDVVSQRALKHVLDAEGWRVRIVPTASHALPELASGQWDLVIVNVALTDMRGPLFSILKELAQADTVAPQESPD